MPVENERKFILDVANPDGLIETLIAQYDADEYEISQGYLTDHVRVRFIVSLSDSDEVHMFTFKMQVGDELIEIKTPISKEDFAKLWQVANRIVRKTRLRVPLDDLMWEVDFFKEPSEDIFMVMAEVELPEGVDEPDELPPFIEDILLYRVARDDHRFKNINLSDIEATKRLLKTLRADK